MLPEEARGLPQAGPLASLWMSTWAGVLGADGLFSLSQEMPISMLLGWLAYVRTASSRLVEGMLFAPKFCS